MRSKMVRLALCISSVLAFLSGSASAESTAVLDSQLAGFVKDAALRAYLAQEASSAKVSAFHVIGAVELAQKCTGAIYGCSTWDVSSRRSDVYLNGEISGGLGVVNITHEVAHVGAFALGCYSHGDVWLDYLSAMAQRYEATFPGGRWGSADPTDSMQKYATRYALERPSCPTANTPDMNLALSRVELVVPKALTEALSGKVTIVIRSLDGATKRMLTHLEATMTADVPGVFSLTLDDDKARAALDDGSMVCVSLEEPFYLDLGEENENPMGLCYVSNGKLWDGPGASISAPNSDGVLTFNYSSIAKR